jgi:hypothetical protein
MNYISVNVLPYQNTRTIKSRVCGCHQPHKNLIFGKPCVEWRSDGKNNQKHIFQKGIHKISMFCWVLLIIT